MRSAFLLGSILYPAIELAWRGRTHPAMALAGGASLVALCGIHRMQKKRPLWQQAMLGGVTITGIEYLFGKIFNQRYQIWDYRKSPLNVRGQICVPYTLAWCGLSALALLFMRTKESMRS